MSPKSDQIVRVTFYVQFRAMHLKNSFQKTIQMEFYEISLFTFVEFTVIFLNNFYFNLIARYGCSRALQKYESQVNGTKAHCYSEQI